MGNELRQALSDAHEALESIVLAGMSGSGQESEEGMQRWHAQRAWDFISIAARALDPIKTALAASAAAVPADERVKAEPAASEPLFLIVGGGDQISTEIVPLSRLDTAYLLMQWGDLDPDDDQQREALEHFHDPDEWQYMDPLRGGEGRVPTIFSIAFEDGGVSVYRLPDAAPQPAAPHPPTDTSREQGAPGKWEGAEEWMPLAWELCANECGEDACTELIWEGGPIKEPWGDRWLKYEDQAKEMIAMVRKHVPATLPTDTSAARPEQVEIIARWACDLAGTNPDQVLDVNPTKLAWHRYDRAAATLLAKVLAAQPASTPDASGLTIPNDCPHMIIFDDADRKPMMFAGHGARAAALKAYEQASASWNAHLFVCIDHNSRDEQHSVAKVATPTQDASDLLAALQNLLCYDQMATDYDGTVIHLCPSCGKQDGAHSESCDFQRARAVIARSSEGDKP